MSICQTGELGLHRLEWVSTMDGKGYWLCLNSNCGEVEISGDDHNGG